MSPLALIRSLVARPPRPPLIARAAGRTTTGRRSANQDALVVRPDLGLFAVADGMGGYQGGEIASQLAVEALVTLYERHQDDGDCTWPHVPEGELSLQAKRAIVAVQLAHRAVRARRTGALSQMGSTVVLASLEGSRLVVAHVGDSRAVLVRAGGLVPLTRDHSFVAELEARGATGPDELSRMAAHFGHMITKAIGHGEHLEPSVRELEVEEGDVVLLSSDGLHGAGVLGPAEITDTLSLFAPDDAAEILVARSLEAGSTDNVTAVILRLERA